MSGTEATMSQVEIMLDFMERNGDLSEFEEGNVKDELRNLHKWIELSDMLNDKLNGDPKPLDEWKKCWRNLKAKAHNKFQRTVTKSGVLPVPTEIDKRVRAVMEKERKEVEIIRKRKLSTSSELQVDEEQNISEDESNDQEVEDEENQDGNKEQKNNKELRCLCVPSRSDFLWALQNAMVPFNDSSLTAANFGASTSFVSFHQLSKRKKQNTNELVDVAEKYLEFEKKRAVLEHGRELLRMKQNEKHFSIMGRVVKTLEVCSSTLTKCVDGFLNLL